LEPVVEREDEEDESEEDAGGGEDVFHGVDWGRRLIKQKATKQTKELFPALR
jgi:hypothetical protein